MTWTVVSCPSCGARFDVAQVSAGSSVRCGRCQGVVAVPADGRGAAPVPSHPSHGKSPAAQLDAPAVGDEPPRVASATSPIRVIVNGARGRMGTEAVRAVSAAADLALVAATDAGDDLRGTIAAVRAEVVVDFTVASAALANFETIVAAGACPVMGTSGFGPAEIAAARALCERHGRPGIIAPNFAISSVLLARFAAEAARILPHVELIEAHHDRKEDSPSGTAIKVALDVAAARREIPAAPAKESVPGVRGGVVEGVRVHSIRVPGLLARMECLFGGQGDTLTIRHDTLTRESFMPGVLLAVRRVRSLSGFVYGLEHLL